MAAIAAMLYYDNYRWILVLLLAIFLAPTTRPRPTTVAGSAGFGT